jgi:adenosylhomocysteine nucleosidase
MKIGIIVAMDKEFAQLKTLLDDPTAEQHGGKDFVIGTVGNNDIVAQTCGIGKVNAAIGTVEMIDHYHPDLVISTGVAGGADVRMEPLDIVVGTQYVYHDVYCGDNAEYGQLIGLPPHFTAPKEYVEKAKGMSSTAHIFDGLIVSGDWFVDSREKMQQILDKFPKAEAVDMESCAIAQTCYLYKTPFLSFRIISDVPLKDTKAAQYFDFWDRMAEGSFNETKNFLESLSKNKEKS